MTAKHSQIFSAMIDQLYPASYMTSLCNPKDQIWWPHLMIHIHDDGKVKVDRLQYASCNSYSRLADVVTQQKLTSAYLSMSWP